MRERRNPIGSPGLTLVELIIVVVIVGLLSMVGLPFFSGVIQASRLDGATRQIASDMREAQARASLIGWQFRVQGFNASSTDARKNQYRLIGRSSAAVAWPLDTVGSFQGATQMAGEWIEVDRLFPGVRVNASSSSPRFWVGFDPRGAAFDIETSCNPMVISGPTGATRSITVTTAGRVRIL